MTDNLITLLVGVALLPLLQVLQSQSHLLCIEHSCRAWLIGNQLVYYGSHEAILHV